MIEWFIEYASVPNRVALRLPAKSHKHIFMMNSIDSRMPIKRDKSVIEGLSPIISSSRFPHKIGTRGAEFSLFSCV